MSVNLVLRVVIHESSTTVSTDGFVCFKPICKPQLAHIIARRSKQRRLRTCESV